MTQSQKCSVSNTELIARKVNFDTIDEQIATLRALRKLPLEERNAILAEQAAAIAHHFVSGSDEMEWAEEYVEDEDWDNEY